MSLLNHLAELWGSAILRASLQGGLALLLALALGALLKNLSPRIRCVLWRLAYLKLGVALFWAGGIPLRILPPDSSGIIAAPIEAAPPIIADGIHAASLTAPAAAAASAAPTLPSVLSVLMILWAGVALWRIGRLVVQWGAARKLRAALTFASDPELIALYHELSAHVGLPDAPPLKVGPQIRSPLLLGIVMPTIALPSDFLQTLSASEARMILAHELAHLRRHDLVWALLPAVAQALFFFHPLVWLAHRELRIAQEIACDELAVTGTQSAGSTYGSLLVRIATGYRHQPEPGLIMATMAESFDNIPRRVNAMRYLRTPSSTRRALSLVALVTLGTVGLAPWKVSARIGSGAIYQGSGRYTVRLAPNSFGNGSFGNGSSGRTFSSGGGFASGGSFSQGFSGGFSSGGGSFSSGPGGSTTGESFRSNVAISLDVLGASREDLLLLAGIDGGVEATDNLGNAVRGPQMPSLVSITPPGSAGKREMVFLQLPDTSATKLTSLDGNLVVMSGVVHELAFPAGSLKAGARQSHGAVSVQIESARQNESGVEVNLSYTMPPPPGSDERPNAMAMLEQMQLNARSVTVELVDSSGKVYAPSTRGGGSGGGRVYRSGQAPAPAEPVRAAVNVGFVLPNGATPATLRVYIVERTGPNRKIPFHLADIPVSPQ